MKKRIALMESEIGNKMKLADELIDKKYAGGLENIKTLISELEVE